MASSAHPLLSVVLSVYNGETFLAQAIASILSQSYDNFELIVVDDGSTDRSRAILEGIRDSRVRLIYNPSNIGQTASLNIGLKSARGVYIARHDADDESYPVRFARQVEFLENHPAVGLLGTAYQLVDKDGRVLDEIYPPVDTSALKARLEYGNIFCHGAVMMRRNVLEAVGGYREQFRVTQDYDLWLRISEHCELATLPEILYKFRFDAQSVTQKRRSLQLSYQRLARELAYQRRNQHPEREIPDDITTHYPPEAGRLFGYARWAAYLFYSADQKPQASSLLRQAYEMLPSTNGDELSWDNWTLSRARTLSGIRGDVNAGVEFIKWVYDAVSLSPSERNSLIARYSADQAYLANQQGHRRQVIINFLRAIQYDPNWLVNKGLWAIALRGSSRIH